VTEPAGRFAWEARVRSLPRAVLPPQAKLLALILATYADKRGGGMHPGNARLAGDTGFDRATVLRHMATLRDLHLIARTYRARTGRPPEDRAALADEYRLVLRQTWKWSQQRDHIRPRKWSQNAQEVVAKGREVVALVRPHHP